MARGTEVGRGYVKLEINGDGMNEQIVEDVDKSGKDIDKVGQKHGEDYGDGFDEGFFDRIKDTLSTHLEAQLDRDFKNMGRRLGNSLGNSISKKLEAVMGEKMDEIEQSMGRLIDTVETKVSGNGGAGGGGGGGGGGRPTAGGVGDGTPDDPNRAFFAAFERARAALHTAANKMIADSDKVLLKKQEDQMKILLKAEEAKQKAIASMEQENSKIVQRIVENRVKLQQKSNDTILKDDQELFKRQQKIFDDAVREEEKRNRKRTNADGSARGLGQRISGIRPRNNALNLLTLGIGGVVSLAEKATKGAGNLFKAFTTGFSAAGEDASILQKGLSGVASAGEELGSGIVQGFASLVASGPAAVAALATVLLGASALVSVLTALIGVVVALSATIVSALVGALAVAGAGIFALVAAAGLAVVAFKSMSKEQKDLFKQSFTPFLQDLKGIGRLVINEVAPSFKVMGKNLKDAIDLIAPFAGGIGKAFGSAGEIFTKALSGPGFQQFAVAMGTYLPTIITNLSTALGGFLNGALALFAAILPYVDQFAAHLATVATNFAAFATGTDGGNGPNRISDFVGRAVASLQSLWNFLQAVSGLISRVLFSAPAQGVGNGLFDGLTRSINNLRARITDADIQRWLDSAGKFARQTASFIQSLYKILEALNSSGVLSAITFALHMQAGAYQGIAKAISAVYHPFQTLGSLAQWVANILYSFSHSKFTTSQFKGPLGSLYGWIGKVAGAASVALSMLARLVGAQKAATTTNLFGGGGFIDTLKNLGSSIGNLAAIPSMPKIPSVGSFGGGGASGSKGPSASDIKKSMAAINTEIRKGLDDAVKSSDPDEVRSNLADLVTAANDAAADLGKAARKRAANAGKLLSAQEGFSSTRVDQLIAGLKVQNATLTDYASARGYIAAQLATANTDLTNAISLRDNYTTSVEDSLNSYAGLATTVAQTINGIQQTLTTTDITTNLQARLDKIKAFQHDLQVLLAQGLSDSAYKQIVDAGVDAGTTLTQALLNGGSGAVGAVNSLVEQINNTASDLGNSASSQLYQAGVDAAQGLVDGLMSLSAQLDAAAVSLGDSIAKAIKKALGIKSPSTVMYEAMGYVGDGIEAGLDSQHVKVGRAAGRLSDQIAVSPEAAAYANAQAAPRVSGNSDDPRFRDLIVQTPTEDPKAVAMEVVNEITGRL